MIKTIVDRLKRIRDDETALLEDVVYRDIRGKYEERNKDYQVGDIILTKYYSTYSRKNVGAHRIMIITNKVDSRGFTQYEGFPLKTVYSNNDKSNKNKQGGYPNCLYIKDYSTILEKGEDVPYPSKEAFIDILDLARFRSYDISPQESSYAGHAKDEFYNFVMSARRNYESGGDNSDRYWE